jgi:hypothetical protein
MHERTIRLRIPRDLYVEYKILCARLELSLPKQTTELIRQFVALQKQNIEIMKLMEET